MDAENKEQAPAAGHGGGGGHGGGNDPGNRAGLGDHGDDDLQRAIDHGWARHDPELLATLGTKHPKGTTLEQAAAVFREIAARERIEAPAGPVNAVSRARLDAGEVTLVERRDNFENLFGRSGDVRYEIRLAGKNSTAHPVDGEGVTRHVKRHERLVEVRLPLGSRPIGGWDAGHD